MDEETKTQLLNLYAQKGELLTEVEMMQNQLQRINQQIIQVRNTMMQQQDNENKTKEKE